MPHPPGSISHRPRRGGLVLTAFGRINGGNALGDQALAERFLNLFYRI